MSAPSRRPVKGIVGQGVDRGAAEGPLSEKNFLLRGLALCLRGPCCGADLARVTRSVAASHSPPEVGFPTTKRALKLAPPKACAHC